MGLRLANLVSTSPVPLDVAQRLTLSHNKHLSRGHYLVDDRANNGAEAFGKVPGQKWIHFGHEPFHSWAEVVAYLKEGAAPSKPGA